MQGSDLKAIRQSLGLSQEEFATQLGMTQKYIGLMERDQATIEARTELAALYLAEKTLGQRSMLQRVHDQLAYDSVEAFSAGDSDNGKRLGSAMTLIRPLVEARTFQATYDAVLALLPAA